MKAGKRQKLIGEAEFRWAKLALYLVLSLYAGWVLTPNFPFDLRQGLVVLIILALLAPLLAIACYGFFCKKLQSPMDSARE